MAKGVVALDSMEFARRWIKGCQSEMTLKEIAESMGMEYNACAARAKSMAKRIVDFDKFQPKAGKRGRQLKETEIDQLNDLVSEALGE